LKITLENLLQFPSVATQRLSK